MRLERISLRAAYGKSMRLELALGERPELTLVVGANESGKTTLARVARSGIWAQKPGPFEASVDLRRADGEPLQNQLSPFVLPVRSGRWPRLPAPELAGCWSLSLDDFGSAAGAEGIAQRLKEELNAGFDLEAVKGGIPSKEAAAHRARAAGQKLSACGATRKARRREMQDVLEREAQRNELVRELDAARERNERKSGLERALAYVRASARLPALEARLALHDPHLGLLRESDLADLRELETEIEEAARTTRSLGAERSSIESRMQALGLPERGLSDAALAHLVDRENDLVGAKEDCVRLERLLDDREREWVALSGGLALEPGFAVDPAVLAELKRAGRELEAARARQESHQVLIDRLPEAGDRSTSEEKAEAARHDRLRLTDWLEAAGRSDSESNPEEEASAGAWPHGVLACLFLLIALVLWLERQELGLFVSIVGALGAAWFAWRARATRATRATDTTGSASLQRPPLEGLRGEVPSEWTIHGIVLHLASLNQGVEQHERLERLRTEQEEAQRKSSRLREEWSLAVQAFRDALQAAGLPTGESGFDAVLMAERVARLEASRLELERARATCAQARARRERAEAERARVLELVGIANPEGAVESDHLARDLREREQERRRLASDLELKVRQGVDAAARLERLGVSRRAFHAQRSIELDAFEGNEADGADIARRELMDRLGRLPDYLSDRKNLEDAQKEQEVLRAVIESARETLPDPLAGTAELEAALELAHRSVDEVEERRAELTRIDTDVAAQGRSTELEKAEWELKQAEADLLSLLEDQLQDAALCDVVEDVQDAWAGGPNRALIQRSSALFRRFTDSRYELRERRPGEAGVAEDRLPLVAQPADGSPAKNLTMLSSGTAAQLHLALRLAVAESEEQSGEVLPLIVDEALSTSDPLRVEQMAGALCELVRSGRQVIFLTSDPEHQARLLQVAELSATPARVLDLDDLRREHARALPRELASVRMEEPPVPRDGEGFESFARRLGVEPVDPFAPVTALPLAHLLSDDLATLALLACERYDKVGILQAAARGGALPEELSALWQEKLGPRVEVAAAFLQSWGIGRARRFDPDLIRTLSVSKSTKLEDITRLAAQVNGEARAFLDLLGEGAVKGLRRNLIPKLEEDLARFLPDGEPLEAEALLERTLSNLGDLLGSGRITRAAAAALVEALSRACEESESLAWVGDLSEETDRAGEIPESDGVA